MKHIFFSRSGRKYFIPSAKGIARAAQFLCAASGVGLVGVGVWMIYHPLAPIFLGIVLLLEVFTSSKGESR